MTAPEYGFLMTALPSREQAADIARRLVDGKLAACVQLLPIESFYRWEGRTENAAEWLLLIKTRTALFEPVMAEIKSLHPYEVPEITGTPFSTGLADYFGWIDTVTRA